MRDRGLGAGDDRHHRPLARMAADRCIRLSPSCVTCPATSARYSRRTVRACNWRTRSVCAVSVLRHHQQSGGLLVEPMDDAGARHAGELRTVREQSVEHRAAPVAAARMHDEPRRLVDDDQCVVLVDDAERDRFGDERDLGRIGLRFEQHDLAAAHTALGFGRCSVDDDPAALQPRLQPAARILGKQCGERAVQPISGVPGRDHDRLDLVIAVRGRGGRGRRDAGTPCAIIRRVFHCGLRHDLLAISDRLVLIIRSRAAFADRTNSTCGIRRLSCWV